MLSPNPTADRFSQKPPDHSIQQTGFEQMQTLGSDASVWQHNTPIENNPLVNYRIISDYWILSAFLTTPSSKQGWSKCKHLPATPQFDNITLQSKTIHLSSGWVLSTHRVDICEKSSLFTKTWNRCKPNCMYKDQRKERARTITSLFLHFL